MRVIITMRVTVTMRFTVTMSYGAVDNLRVIVNSTGKASKRVVKLENG